MHLSIKLKSVGSSLAFGSIYFHNTKQDLKGTHIYANMHKAYDFMHIWTKFLLHLHSFDLQASPVYGVSRSSK